MYTQKPDGYLSIKESAELLGVTTRTIHRLIQVGKVVSVQLVNKRVYVEKESLLKYGGNNE
jgi:excisionase family DNA binding protein